MTDAPDDKFRPESLADPYRAEIARLRALLVKACVEIARFSVDWRMDASVRVYLDSIEYVYGVRLKANMVTRTFEEDTGK